MAKQFNPFHKWLGFDKDLTHPNHFQLFGVKPNSDDPIGFRKRIHSQAKALLAKLEAMSDEEIGKRKPLHTKMRRFVVRAHETMLDDKLRTAYLKGLRQKARDDKGSAKPLAVPPPVKGSSTQSTSATSKHQVMPTIKGMGTPTIKQSTTHPLEEKPTVPMAIPLSKSSAEESSEFESTANSEVNFDQLQSEEILIRPGRIKRKKSWIVPVLCGLMTLLCIAGISALVMNFGNKFETVTPKPKNENSAVAKVVASAEEPVEPMTPDDIRKATEELVNAKRDEQPEFGSSMTPEASADVGANAEMEEKPAVTPAREPKPITLSEPQLQSVRFLFERARKEMKRGRLESAKRQYVMVDSILDRDRPEGDQAVLYEELENGRAVIKYLEGFWEQVKRSSQQITGGELEPEPGVIVGFVEGRENDVVLRYGENVEIPYRSLRPGLAMLLAEKKAAPNMPAWRQQQAAFRILHSNGTAESKEKIDQLISAAEADEYDGSALRGFWNSSFENVIPASTMTSLNNDVKTRMTKELVGDKYQTASGLSAGAAGEFASGFTAVAYDDPMMRIVALSEAVELSRRSGDAFQLVDSIDELHRWTEADTAKLKADGFRAITSKLPSASEARLIGEAFYEFLLSPDASAIEPSKLTKLKERVLESVTKNGLVDLTRLISQTMD